jgi:hypothetical protein
MIIIMFYTPFVLSIVLEYNLITELQSYLNNSINYKIMNINKFTIKSQEAIQLSTISSGFWPTADRKRTFSKLSLIDENVAPF